MKGKYFKLKLFLSLSLIFCIVGGVGSIMLTYNIYHNSIDYIKKNTIIEKKEIYRSKEKIEVLDLSKFSPNNIILQKSTDGENSIEVSYNKAIKKVSVEKDIKFSEKINVFEEKINKTNSDFMIFDFVERTIKEYLEKRHHNIFGSDLHPNAKENIVIKLTEPTELIVDEHAINYIKLDNVDQSLLKRELNFKYYNDNISKSNLIKNGDISLKDYDSSYLPINTFRNLNINVELLKMKDFNVRGHCSNLNLTIDAKNVEDTVEIDLENFNANIEIKNANNVVIRSENYDNIEYIVKVNVDDVNREYVIPARYKTEEKKTIVIDAKSVNYIHEGDIVKIK